MADALQRAIALFSSTIHRDAIITPVVNSLQRVVADSVNHYPFELTPFGVSFTRQHGIGTNSFGGRAHPHAIHKTVELYWLHQAFRSFFSHPTTVYFMKEDKFNSLPYTSDVHHELVNVSFVPRDYCRYANPVERPLPCQTQHSFFHDSLMFLTPSSVYSFFQHSPSMRSMGATYVTPHETRFDLNSLEPQLYRHTRMDDQLVYELEGDANGAYVQPFSSRDWLSIGGIRGPDFDLGISFEESIGSMFKVVITKYPSGGVNFDSIRPFTGPESILLPNPVDLEMPINARLVPLTVYRQLFTYTRAVRTLRVTDPKVSFAFIATRWSILGFIRLLGSISLNSPSSRPNFVPIIVSGFMRLLVLVSVTGTARTANFSELVVMCPSLPSAVLSIISFPPPV